MSDIDRVNELFKRANDEFNRTGRVSIDLLKKLQAAVGADTEEVKENTKEQQKLENKSAYYTKQLVNLTKSLGSNLQSIRKNRESFTGLSGTVKTGIQAAGVAAVATTKTVSSVAGTVGDIALAFPNQVTLVVAGVAKGIEWLAGKSSKAAEIAAKVAPVFADFALKEIQDVVDSYQKVGSVGMSGEQGMTGLRESANRAGLSLKTYSSIVARNSEALASAGGSAESGAAVLDKIAQATESAKDQYLKLGFTYEEQEDLAAKSLNYRRRMGLAKTTNMQELGSTTKKYYDLVDEIARMTGQNRSQAAAILERQQSNLRFALTQQAITEQYGGDTTVADRLSKVASALEAHGGKGGAALSTAFMDATAGRGPDTARSLDILTGGQGQAIIESLKRGDIDDKEAIRQLQRATREAYLGRGGTDFAGRVGGFANITDEELLGADTFARTSEDALRTLGEVNKSQTEAKETADQLSNDAVDAQHALRDFAKGMDQLVAKNVLPRAATITNEFTQKLKQFMDKGAEELGLTKKTADIPTTGVTPGGTPPPPGGVKVEAKDVQGPPDLTRITTPSGKSAEVNKDAAPAFQKLVNWLEEQAGYKINSLGGYVDRDVRGRPGMKSVHAVGGAIDINPEQNPLGGSLVTDMPPEIGVVAKGLGLGWGGNWTSRKDAMHFSAATREGGSILKFAEGGVASGPKGGYNVMMHGTEAVVPLPNGTDVPITGGIISDKVKEQIALFNEQGRMIDQMIMAVKDTNDANQRILAMKSS